MKFSILQFLRNVPTTKLRISVSIALTVVVVLSVLFGIAKNPPLELWSYLVLSQGLDVVQYHQNNRKRISNSDDGVITTTDIQELVETSRKDDEK